MSDQAGYGLTPKVSHVIDRKLGIDYGFMYHISTPEELESYWTFSAIPRWRRGFSDFMACDELNHPATAEGNIIDALVEASGKSPLMVFGSLVEKANFAMVRSLRDGPIVINRNGGFFPLRGQEIKETRTMQLWYLPGASISISQWPNGTHFYARVGDEDVEVSGRRKWDTKDAAERAAKRFAEENGITLEMRPA